MLLHSSIKYSCYFCDRREGREQSVDVTFPQLKAHRVSSAAQEYPTYAKNQWLSLEFAEDGLIHSLVVTVMILVHRFHANPPRENKEQVIMGQRAVGVVPLC